MKALRLILLFAAAAGASAAPIPVAELHRSEPVDFAREIYPLLKQNCLACHNSTKAKANLNLESPALMAKGGDGGPAIVPGKGSESLMLKSAAHLDEDLVMPPVGNKANAAAFTSEQLGLLRLWIDQGAKGEAVAEAKGPLPWRTQPANGPVQATAISPDGRLVAAARANRLELCELSTGRVIAQLGDPELSKLDAWKHQLVADRDSVMSVAFASDDLLATGGFRTVRLWRRMPRGVKRDFGALAEAATALALSNDGKLAAAGDVKGSVWLWAPGDEKFEPVQLKDHPAPISALAFSPDGTALLSAAEDKSVCAWDIKNRVVAFKGQAPAEIYALAPVRGTSEILAGCGDGVARIWEWLKEPPAVIPPPLREFKLQSQPIYAMEATANGTFVWASADGSLRVSSLTDGEEQRRVAPEHPLSRRVTLMEYELQVAQSLAATRKGQLGAAAEKLKKETEGARTASQAFEKARSEVRKARLEAEAAAEAQRQMPDDKTLQEASKKAAEVLTRAEASLRAAKVNAELSARLAADAAGAHATAESALAGAEAALAEAQAGSDACKKRVAEPLAAARYLHIAPGGNSVTVIGADESMRHVDFASGELLEAPDRAKIAVATSAGELLTAGADKRIRLTTARRVWALERVIGNVEDPALLADRVTAVAFSPDGKLLATGGGTPSRDGELKLWRVEDGTLVRHIAKAHADTVNAVAFSPDGELLATAASDRFARIWRVTDGTRIGNLEGHTGHVLSVAWRADGLALATGGADRTLRVWDLATRKQTKDINNFNAEIAAISFVGPGENLLAACGDKTIRLGDKQLPDAADAFPFCATSDLPGRIVAAGGHDGVLRVWSAGERKLLRTFTPAAL
ncbi:WD40 domain-containing protein [Verrucomicrobiota bacterium sgz303538]